MPQPNSAKITSPPAVPGMPYDACSNDGTRPWEKLEQNAGPASIHTGRVEGEFQDGPGPWRQV